MEKEAFYQRLRRLRQEKKFTMKAFSQAIEVPESTYREWEYGRAIQGMPYPRIAKVLNVSIHELLTGEVTDKSSLLQTIQIIEEMSKKARLQLESFL